MTGETGIMSFTGNTGLLSALQHVAAGAMPICLCSCKQALMKQAV